MKNNSIKINYFMNILLSMTSTLFPLITYPYVSRVLHPDGIGVVSYAQAVSMYFAMFAQLGLPVYGIREVAKLRENKASLSRFIKSSFIISFVLGIILYSVYDFGVIFFLEDWNERVFFFVMGINILLGPIGMEWLYKGIEQYTYITIRSSILKLTALIMVFLFVKDSNDLYIYGILTIIATTGSNIINFILSFNKVDYRVRVLRNDIIKVLKEMLVFFSMSVATVVYTNLDTIMLGLISGNHEVGIYTTATKVKTVLVVIVTSLGAVMLPRLSYYFGKEDHNYFMNYLKKSSKFTFLLSVPITLYFLIFSREVISCLAGSEYKASVYSLAVLMPTVFFIGLTNLIGMQVLIPIGKERTVVFSLVCGAISDFVINLILIPKFGALGAAIGTTFAEFMVLVIQVISYRKLINKDVNNKKQNLMIYLVGSILATIISYVSTRFIKNNIAILLISMLIFGFVYLFWLIIKKDEIIIGILLQMKTCVKYSSGE